MISLIKNLALSFVVWLNFIHSLLIFFFISKKKIILVNVENWHLVISHYKNIQRFSNTLKKNYSIIYINLSSEIMCFLLNLLLNTDKNNFLYNKFSKIFRLVSWTIFLRAHKVEIDIANTDIANHKKYINLFNEKTTKILKKTSINNLYDVFTNKKISAVLLSQIAYSEIYIYYFACLNKIKILFWGAKVLNLEYPYKSISKQIYNGHLINKKNILKFFKKNANIVLKNRVKGVYKNSSHYKFYLEGKFNSDIKFFSSDKKNKPTLFLYLHCFSDSPYNYSNLHEKNLFIDFYEASLFVIDFAIKNNYKLFIKPHPQSSSIYYKNDIYFINNLKKKTVSNNNVSFVDKLTLKSIKRSHKPIIITCAGTVTLEAAYSGIPSINLGNSYLNYTNMCLNLNKRSDFKFIINNSYKLYKFKVARKEAIYFQASQMYDQHKFLKNYKL